MITRVDPENFAGASTVQVDSDAGDPWLAMEEVENWATEHGFVRTSEYHPRQAIVAGRRRFRSVCYRITADELAAIDQSQREMTERGERLRGAVPHSVGTAG